MSTPEDTAPIRNDAGHRTITRRWRSPGGRYELVCHLDAPQTATDPGRGVLIAYEWDPTLTTCAVMPDLGTQIIPSWAVAALARAYAYLFVLEDPGTQFAKDAVDAAAMALIEAPDEDAERAAMALRMIALGRLALPVGVVDYEWRTA